ncbi:MAG: hypothetical protein ACI35O_16020 [Bacillaceae bacterium]
MYISPTAIYVILATILAILGGVALVYLILLLNNARKFYGEVNNLIGSNKQELESFLRDLPVATHNMRQASEHIKDVTEAVTETAADFLVTRDNVKTNIEILTEILMIVKKVFFKNL